MTPPESDEAMSFELMVMVLVVAFISADTYLNHPFLPKLNDKKYLLCRGIPSLALSRQLTVDERRRRHAGGPKRWLSPHIVLHIGSNTLSGFGHSLARQFINKNVHRLALVFAFDPFGRSVALVLTIKNCAIEFVLKCSYLPLILPLAWLKRKSVLCHQAALVLHVDIGNCSTTFQFPHVFV